MNPLKFDPTRTTLLRKKFEAECKTRFNALKQRINEAFKTPRYVSDAEYVDQFSRFLTSEIERGILNGNWWDKYVDEAYRKGAGRSYDDVNGIDLSGGAKGQFVARTLRTQRSIFTGNTESEPTTNVVSTERVKFLSQRLKQELKGATDAMAQSIARSLSDGLSKGKTPIEIARAIRRNVDGIGIHRSRLIAQTELTRAVAEGALDAMEDLGVSEASVAVEWDTTSQQPCKMCSALDGIVLSLKEMRGLIPRHPGCKCVPIPVLRDKKGLKKSESAIRSAIKKSEKAEQGDLRWNPPKISKKRPPVGKSK